LIACSKRLTPALSKRHQASGRELEAAGIQIERSQLIIEIAVKPLTSGRARISVQGVQLLVVEVATPLELLRRRQTLLSTRPVSHQMILDTAPYL
jgi:hypothetical protein